MFKRSNRIKLACYSANVTMSVVGNLSPILFLTFHTLYGISYSKLGLLVLINFSTQLLIDLIFSFYSHRFNIGKTVKMIPWFAGIGLLIYGLSPFFMHNVYTGLVIGTVVFSTAGGLGEVLISPVIASIPSENPEREMSKLHSAYAWGVVFVILISTVFMLFAGSKRWQWLALFFVIIPIASAILFLTSDIPHIDTPKRAAGALKLLKNKGVWLSVFAIFLGGAAECTMAQWSSGYLEQALGIPKIYGDLFGVAMFALMLGLGRSIYAKIGKNLGRVLTFGAIGATLCYLIAAVSPIPVIGLFACALTGFFTSMLWPGNLLVASERFPEGGVFIYAMMASGGDLGASLVPQLLGVITDAVIAHPNAVDMASRLNILPEQLGMKVGMLFGMLFPLLGIVVYSFIWKNHKIYRRRKAI